MLDTPLRLVLSPRAAVANVINRGYEQRGDLVTEIIEEMLRTKMSERQGRVIDYDEAGSMEEKKREGYF